MSSFTPIVNADSDPTRFVAEVASYLPEEQRAAFVATADTYIAANATTSLVMFLLEKTNVFLDLEQDSVAQSLFEGIFTLIFTQGGVSQESLKLTKDVIAIFVAEKTKAERRLNALVALFNLVALTESKFAVVVAIFQFALDTSLAALVAPFSAHVDAWLSAWNLNVEQKRLLLSTVAKVLIATKQNPQALRINIKFFQTFKNETISAAVDAELKAATLSAINSAVEDFEDRVALLNALKNLKVNQQWAALNNLLKILCDGSLEDFLSFKTTNAKVFTDNNLDVAEIENKIKLLALSSLAAEAANRAISFQTISTALKISADEVELWIIDAISQGIINGSIDQLNSTVTITQYAHRSFGINQWKQLQQTIAELRKNLKAASGSLDSVPKTTV